MRIMAGFLALAVGASCARAAALRQFRSVDDGAVRLSDLFDGVPAAGDRVLGAAPPPGARIDIGAPQLAAIARDYGVDWRPLTGAEHCVLERAGVPFTVAQAEALLRPALLQAGAPEDLGIDLPGYQAPLLPPGAAVRASLSDLVYSQGDSSFTATLRLQPGDGAPVELRLAGQAVPMIEAAVLVRRMPAASILTPDDVRPARVPAASLRGEPAIGPDAAVGLALRLAVPAGAVLAAPDLVRPVLVSRNDPVRMVLTAGALSLEATGTALEEGAMGAHVRVQNPSSRAVVVAEVTGADEVRVVPGRPMLVQGAAP